MQSQLLISKKKTLCRIYPERWQELREMDAKAPNDFKPGISLQAIEDEVKNRIVCLTE